MAFRISTNAFQPGGNIPVNFTKDGPNKSPLICWEHAPADTQSFALVVEDPDAPSGTFYHWLVYDIPPNVTQLDPELPHEPLLDEHIKQGTNDFGEIGYSGPQPPSGKKHQYVFRLYALARPLGITEGLGKDEVLQRIDQAGVIARAEMTGFYKSLKKAKVA